MKQLFNVVYKCLSYSYSYSVGLDSEITVSGAKHNTNPHRPTWRHVFDLGVNSKHAGVYCLYASVGRHIAVRRSMRGYAWLYASVLYVCSCVLLWVHESVSSYLFTEWTLMKLGTITHYRVYMTLRTFSRSWVQRSRSQNDGYRNLVNSTSSWTTEAKLTQITNWLGVKSHRQRLSKISLRPRHLRLLIDSLPSKTI